MQVSPVASGASVTLSSSRLRYGNVMNSLQTPISKHGGIAVFLDDGSSSNHSIAKGTMGHICRGIASVFCAGMARSLYQRRTAATVTRQALPQSDISFIELRVGLIVKAEKHPDSEKLLVEEIDLGEGAPRKICSGISAYVAPEDLAGRKCVVVANLKERNLGGVPSNGMLLCASTGGDAKNALAIVDAPIDAQIGERIKIEIQGTTHGDAAAPNKVAKKKLYEKVAPHFHTNSDGTVCFRESPFMTAAGPCTASILNGSVS